MRPISDVSCCSHADDMVILTLMNEREWYEARTVDLEKSGDPIEAQYKRLCGHTRKLANMAGVNPRDVDWETVAFHCIKQSMDQYAFNALIKRRYNLINKIEPMENIMNPTCGGAEVKNHCEAAPLYETVHMVSGRRVEDWSDNELISKIAALEEEMKYLKRIKAKSTKITAKIAELQKGIDFIVDHLDAV